MQKYQPLWEVVSAVAPELLVSTLPLSSLPLLVRCTLGSVISFLPLSNSPRAGEFTQRSGNELRVNRGAETTRKLARVELENFMTISADLRSKNRKKNLF